MPDFAEVARTLTDTTVAHLAAIAPLLAGSAVALIGAVVSCVAWLCYAELRRTAHRKQRPQHASCF